jgi:hypothetical protein
VTRLDFCLIGFVCLVILLVALSARAGEPLYNFDVPLHGCAEKVTLVGCDYKATSCKSVKVKFHSATCLTVEAQK